MLDPIDNEAELCLLPIADPAVPAKNFLLLYIKMHVDGPNCQHIIHSQFLNRMEQDNHILILI